MQMKTGSKTGLICVTLTPSKVVSLSWKRLMPRCEREDGVTFFSVACSMTVSCETQPDMVRLQSTNNFMFELLSATDCQVSLAVFCSLGFKSNVHQPDTPLNMYL